jgi:hypothetical protein
VLLIDRNPSLLNPKPLKRALSTSTNTHLPASIASGCWITPTLPEADTFHLTSLLADAHTHALDFYDRIGIPGAPLPWKLFRKSSIPPVDWENKHPRWADIQEGEYRGEKVFECRGDEFRFFDNPRDVLGQIIEDALNHSQACRYMPDVSITHITPNVRKRSFGSGGKSSTHVLWNLYTANQDHPVIQTRQIIFATGADFSKDGPSLVPELNYMHDSMRVSMGSVMDLESSQPFPPYIFQQNMVISPLPIDDSNDAQSFKARLGSTQRVKIEDLEEQALNLLESAKESFPDIPSDAHIVATRTGERLYRTNRLPIVGGLLDPVGTCKTFPNAIHGQHLSATSPRLAGLYFIGGMGSRGFTLAPLLSRFLVEQISGPLDVKSAYIETGIAQISSYWKSRLSPRNVLTTWLRRNGAPLETPQWNVNWPTLIGHSAAFPADYDEAKQSFDIIPTSWNPNRPQFESTYCPLFDDDHTRD